MCFILRIPRPPRSTQTVTPFPYTTLFRSLRPDLATVRGVSVVGNDRFALDTGGPSARAVLAGGTYEGIKEDQIFLVATNVATDRASVGRFAYCAVDGIGEKIPVDVLPRETTTQILTGLGDKDWTRRSFAYDAGLPERSEEHTSDLQSLMRSSYAVFCLKKQNKQQIDTAVD